ncbi:MAG TPA: sugar porter family MFS transporter [Rhodothermales bacterium]|nr:sugar porter family MFS transporter [Rhodothermales bacterium]
MSTSYSNDQATRPDDAPSMAYLIGACLVASLGGLLFGFDTAVISGTVERVTRQYDLSPLLEGWFASSALVGCIVGAAIAGFLGDKYGRKPTLIVSGALFLLSAIGSAIPPTFEMLVGARLIGGVGVGMASVLAPLYISEFSPPHLRGRLVAFYQLSIVTGILLSYLSNWIILRNAQRAAAAPPGEGLFDWIFVTEYWRGMFGAEVIPALLFIVLLLFVPESPRWLIKAGRDEEGFEVLKRISGGATARRESREIKTALSREGGSLRELFQPGLRTALMVGIMLSVFGQLSGVNIVVYYGPKILMTAGYEDLGALLSQVGFGVINLIFTILALLLIDRWGRRPLLIGGMAVVTFALLFIGSMFLAGVEGTDSTVVVSKEVGLWIGIGLCVYMAAIAFSISAVIWVLTPEIFPNRVRGRAASIATFANWTTNSASAMVFPWYVAAFGMHVSFFTSGIICLVATIFFWKFVPETKGRTLEEIERSWRRGE